MTTRIRKLSALLPVHQRWSRVWVVRSVSALLGLAGGSYVFAAGGWSPPVTLSTPVPPSFYATSPAVAINSSGAQVAAWINEDNYLLLQVAAQDAGGGCTPAHTLTSGNDSAGHPALAIRPGANAADISL